MNFQLFALLWVTFGLLVLFIMYQSLMYSECRRVGHGQMFCLKERI